VSGLSFSDFVELNRGIASEMGDDPFLPAIVDLDAGRMSMLGELPDQDAMPGAVRDWASEIGATNFFLAYRNGGEIVIEKQMNGQLVETVSIVIPN